MGKVIGIVSIKGGVGKTTVSASLATSLANYYGKKVLLIDANYSAPNLGLHMDILEPEKTIHHVIDRKSSVKKSIHSRFGVDVIPGDYIYKKEFNHLKLKDQINKVKKDYDFVIVDSSPSLNSEILSTVLAADSLFLVTTPDYPTLSCALKTARLAKQRGKEINGIIMNKVRSPAFEIPMKEIEESTGIPVVAKIPDDKHVIRSSFSRIPVPIYNKKSAFSREINKLSSAITNKKSSVLLRKKFLPFTLKREEINREKLKESFYESPF